MRKLLLIALASIQLSAIAAEKKNKPKAEERTPTAVRVHEAKDVHDERSARLEWLSQQRRDFFIGEQAKY